MNITYIHAFTSIGLDKVIFWYLNVCTKRKHQNKYEHVFCELVNLKIYTLDDNTSYMIVYLIEFINKKFIKLIDEVHYEV